MAVGRGLRITIEGLEEMGADLSRLAKPGLANAIRASLRGAGGQALASEMKRGAPSRSGTLVSGIGVHDTPGDDVLVGYQGARATGSHIMDAREQRGAWVESGVQPHTIRARGEGSLFFAGSHVEEVDHPGQRPQRVAAKALRTAEWEVMADVVDQIDAITGGMG